jgi:N-acetylneuraminate synthase/N,N'-diacetyllegionaminate synthase
MSKNLSSAPIKLGNKKVGDGQPIYIMADLGLTNGGDIQRTFSLIDQAAVMGVDAVKFQMIGPDTLLGDKSVEYTYPTLQDGPQTENMYEMFSKLNYAEAEWAEIAAYVRSKGLEFICTAHTLEAVPILEKLNVNIHKICTWSMTHKRLVQEIGRTGKPLMLDTGMFTTQSLAKTLDWHSEAGGQGAIILHDFHTTNCDQMNFRSIPYMKEHFGFPVGYTPQGRDNDMDYVSIGLGVNILEKRLTVDRSIPQNGHIKALEPNEFSDWIKRVKELERTLGYATVLPTDEDRTSSQTFFKSLYTNCDIKRGDVITDSMFSARRPGTGISPAEIDQFCGRKVSRDLTKETMLSISDFD